MAATRTLLLRFTSVLLFAALYWFKPFSDQDHHPSPTTQPSKDLSKAPTIFKSNQYAEDDVVHVNDLKNYEWPLIYEKDVVALTNKNFSDFMAKNRYVMVLFYAPWCYWSKKMAPDYAAAAKMLKGEAVLVMVDADVERELGRKYKIQGFPTMYFFVGGVRQYRFWEQRTRDAIATWVRSKMALGICNISTMDEAIYTLHAKSRLVLGFLDSLEGSESEELAAASKLHRDINFYRTARADVAELFHINPKIKRPALIFLETVSKNTSIFHGEFTRLAIADFVSRVKHPLVITFTEENAELILQNPMKQLWLFSPAYGSEKVISTFKETAEDFRGKLLFVYVEMNSEGIGQQIAYGLDITGDAPSVIAYRERDAKKHVMSGELTLRSIKSFGQDFLEDKLLSQSDNPTSDSVLKLPSHSNQLRFHM